METVDHTEAVRQVREYIATGRQTASEYRERAEAFELEMLEMRVNQDYDVMRYTQLEAVTKAIREALND